MEKKCRSCGNSIEFLGQTLFSRGEFIMPAEIRLCPQCKSVIMVVAEDFLIQGSAVQDGLAPRAGRLMVKKHGGLIEIMCPKCEANMFFVQHSDVSFGDVYVLTESWICECGTTLETAHDPDPA